MTALAMRLARGWAMTGDAGPRAWLAGLCALLLLFSAGPAESTRVQEEANAWLTGQLLVAARSMRDPNFMQTVIYMVEHNETGAFGLVVNRLAGEMRLSKIMQGLGLEGEGLDGSLRVHVGGPVEQQLPFVLHSADVVVESSRVVGPGIAVTTDPALLKLIGKGEGPLHALFILGYAGWAPGQLEGEMDRGDWGHVPSDEAVVFDEDYDTKWERAIEGFSIDL